MTAPEVEGMTMSRSRVPLCWMLLALGGEASMILHNARVWTGDPQAPWAQAVAVEGARILAVGSDQEALRHRGARTEVRDLEGRFIAPGFIDSHTHFNRAGALLLGVNLLNVADAAGLRARVREAVERLPPGSWLLDGDWGAYEAWARDSSGSAAADPSRPTFVRHRSMIDAITPEHPALLSKWDRSAYLANRLALERAGATCDWDGVACDQRGEMTGLLEPAAAERIRTGGLKGFVDGIMGNSSARFYEPYLHSGARGSWRDMMQPEGNMLRLLRRADAAGLWPQVHAIGDQAIDTLLDLFEQVFEAEPERPRRWRLIHAQVLRGPEVARRIARLGVIAEVQPYHAIDDMRWMEERIGARSRWAYAFKTLQDAGVRLCFGSDWPGTNASWYPSNPLLGIYAAVTRQTLSGTPPGGWFPEQRLDLESALRAYTVNSAWAAGEERLKGAVAPGLLADLVAPDRDPFAIDAAELKDVKVLWTMVGGRIVFGRP